SPGAIVFENDDEYATRSPPSSSKSVGEASPSKRTRPYGSSSSTSNRYSRTSSTTRRRRSVDNVLPLGFWNVGIVYSNEGIGRSRSASASASGSSPSSSIGSASISAPSPRRIFRGRA